MKRINIIGTTGSGKSTFARRLAEKLGYPCIHMDQLFWKSGWVHSSDEEFIPKIEAVVSGDTWVLDGNYSRTNGIKWKHADTVIWLDYSYSRTFVQLLKRTINRAVTREELWPGTGNRETFRQSFMSKDSIFIWFFKSYKTNKTRYGELDGLFRKSPINFIRLRSPREAEEFIKRCP